MLARIGAAIVALTFGMLGHATGMFAKETQYVAVLLSTEVGSPTPQAVIDSLPPSSPPGNAILHAFAVVPPESAAYFLSVRATGDFLNHLNADPRSARAELERYLLIGYSAGTDIKNAEASLRADKFVIAAAASQIDQFWSVTISGFGFADDPSQNGWTQYGRDALNTEAAWKLAGGYALVGDADSGLFVEHPALRQFSGNGEYVGGNFIPA